MVSTRRSKMSRSNKALAVGLSELANLDKRALVQQWSELIGSAPPPYASLTFLRCAVAYEMQTRAGGQVPKRVERVLAAALRSVDGGKGHVAASNLIPEMAGQNPTADLPSSLQPTDPSMTTPQLPPKLTPKLAPGTQLVREWNGRTWQVEVVKGGFVCRGKRYRSLSAIAKMITGAHWSGPRFFGLRP